MRLLQISLWLFLTLYHKSDHISRSLSTIVIHIRSLPLDLFNLPLTSPIKNFKTNLSKKHLLLPINFLPMKNQKLLSFSSNLHLKRKMTQPKSNSKSRREFRAKQKGSSTLIQMRKKKLKNKDKSKLLGNSWYP